VGTSQNGKIERITNKIISKRLDASLAQKLRKTAKNARDSEFLAILTGEPQILAVIFGTILCGMLKLYRNQVCSRFG